MASVFSFADVDGDRIAVFRADIPGEGLGVNIRTDRNGCSLPDADIPRLITALQTVLKVNEMTTPEDVQADG